MVGARGFLGTHLVCAALADGLEVLEFEFDTPALTGGRLSPGIRDCDAVYWLASRCNPASAEADPLLPQADLAEFRAFLSALRASGSRARVILASSGGTVYGNGRPPFREDDRLAPSGAYGRLKVDCEAALAGSGVPGIAARIANPYGPGQRAGTGQGVVAQWLADIDAGRTPRLIGRPDTARDFLYVGDVAQGLLAMATAAFTGPVNLGSGAPTTLTDLATTIQHITGAEFHFEVSAPRPFDVAATWLDTTRACTVLDWAPKTPLARGLSSTWNHAKLTYTVAAP